MCKSATRTTNALAAEMARRAAVGEVLEVEWVVGKLFVINLSCADVLTSDVWMLALISALVWCRDLEHSGIEKID